MTEERLILEFHMYRRKQISRRIVEAMREVAPGGLFKGRANCKTLWDEACWAVQEPEDLEAQYDGKATICQFAEAYTEEVAPEELRLHAYLLSNDTDADGLPYPDAHAFLEDVVDCVCALAASRRLTELEITDHVSS